MTKIMKQEKKSETKIARRPKNRKFFKTKIDWQIIKLEKVDLKPEFYPIPNYLVP